METLMEARIYNELKCRPNVQYSQGGLPLKCLIYCVPGLSRIRQRPTMKNTLLTVFMIYSFFHFSSVCFAAEEIFIPIKGSFCNETNIYEVTAWKTIYKTPNIIHFDSSHKYMFHFIAKFDIGNINSLVILNNFSNIEVWCQIWPTTESIILDDLHHIINITQIETISNPNIDTKFLSLFLPDNKLKRLSIHWCQNIVDNSLEVISKFTNLKDLDLTGCEQITYKGLKNLKDLKNVERISLSCNDNIDNNCAGIISQIISIKELVLESCTFIDDKSLYWIGNMKKLETLDLTDCEKITDNGLYNLKKLNNVNKLYLSGLKEITSKGLEIINNMKLSELMIEGCKKLDSKSMDIIKTQKDVRYLSLEYCNFTDNDIKILENLANIERLQLGECKKLSRECLNTILNYKKLKKLDIREIDITDADIGKISTLCNLEPVQK